MPVVGNIKLHIIYQLLEVPPALLEILVEPVACRGGGEDNAVLGAFCGFADRLLHIPRVYDVHLGGGYQRAYALSAIREQDNVPYRARIKKIPQDIIGDTPVHTAQNKAVGIVKGFYRRDRCLGDSAYAVVDILHAVHRPDVFQ